jgi:hypothetical protein
VLGNLGSDPKATIQSLGDSVKELKGDIKKDDLKKGAEGMLKGLARRQRAVICPFFALFFSLMPVLFDICGHSG